jgi:hypothetical protein
MSEKSIIVLLYHHHGILDLETLCLKQFILLATTQWACSGKCSIATNLSVIYVPHPCHVRLIKYHGYHLYIYISDISTAESDLSQFKVNWRIMCKYFKIIYTNYRNSEIIKKKKFYIMYTEKRKHKNYAQSMRFRATTMPRFHQKVLRLILLCKEISKTVHSSPGSMLKRILPK